MRADEERITFLAYSSSDVKFDFSSFLIQERRSPRAGAPLLFKKNPYKALYKTNGRYKDIATALGPDIFYGSVNPGSNPIH